MPKRPDRFKPRSRAPRLKALAGDARIRGSQFYVIKERQLAREPLCRMCRAKGEYRAATVVDHIRPLADGGREAASNRQSLCKDCHDAKTAAENRVRFGGGGGE